MGEVDAKGDDGWEKCGCEKLRFGTEFGDVSGSVVVWDKCGREDGEKRRLSWWIVGRSSLLVER